jgi:hypothetical protein
MSDWLVCLTYCTPFNVFSDKILAAWPPILFQEGLMCFVYSRVSSGGRVMIQLDKGSPQLILWWYNQCKTFVPKTFGVSS